MNWAAITWLVLLVVFLIAEAACPIHLASIWFAVGAVVAMVISMLGGAVWIQVTVFFLVSGVLLASLWPLVRKYLNPNVEKTNLDAIVGSTGVVTSAIDNLHAQGQIKLGAMEWTARSTTGDPIPVDATVRVDRIEGVKAFVSPVPVPVSNDF